MQIGLIGYAKTGKTTIFNALTQGKALTDKYHSTHEQAHVAVVQVTDDRVTTLAGIYRPKKTSYATIEYHDFPGIFGNSTDNPESSMFTEVRNMDGYAIVLRNFRDIEMDALYGVTNPLHELNNIEQEMILRDLITAEKRLERIELGYKRGVKTAAILSEERILHGIREHLLQGYPLRTMQLSGDDAKTVKGFSFMSQKPLLILLNCSEDNFNKPSAQKTAISAKGYPVEAIAGKFEEELSKLETEEAKDFLEDMGIGESVRERLNHLCYKMMGYISFFTVGSEEVHAWTIQAGANAVTAAGRIHSDLARGFIRAEVFRYDDIIAYGNEKSLREKGLFRLEGKDYIVQDGDIIFIRFNV